MTTQTHQPWKPTCWVGGYAVDRAAMCWLPLSLTVEVQLCELEDDSRQKYAATKATAAILRAMRKPM